MNTKDFMAECVEGMHDGKEKKVASVYWDGATLYSYGRHYPLLVNIGNGRWILNDAGYSSTTGKHISHGRSLNAGVVALRDGRNLPSGFGSNKAITKRVIKQDIKAEIAQIGADILELSPRATRQLMNKMERRAELLETLELLK